MTHANPFARGYNNVEILQETDDCATRTKPYAIHAKTLGGVTHILNSHSLVEAQQVADNIRFQTGFYSRCMEISSAHLTDEGWNFLTSMADISTPTGFLFVAFRIPYCPAVGVKLISTPWTDANLWNVEGIRVQELRQESLDKNVPQELVDVLHLAGEADVRILVFDADAAELEGLAVYYDD
ncbi:ABC transporter substrate-binding protein [Pseudomonas aeruginosa]|uniref:DUF5983 family protein n=1 Tax=Pseudomonas aeruginosa TaxID=287 RepID=UPI000F7D9015|nr:ABC transporter substrate-binding protein [Pseudomonas aeruginosa]RTB44093.1 ABC transporter substrate-binding protein [Pseudomonas aeruginosa]